MARTLDYYFSLASPWAYIGHALLRDIAARHAVTLNHKPIPLGPVFAETGGLPLSARHPVRQRYRWLELQRWRGLSFNPRPRHWPFDARLVDGAVIAILAAHGDPDAFMRGVFTGIWERDEDFSDEAHVAAHLARAGQDAPAILEAARGDLAEAIYAVNLENAVDAGVFGSPAYVLGGEVFWGQDRLELLDDALTSGRSAYVPLA